MDLLAINFLCLLVVGLLLGIFTTGRRKIKFFIVFSFLDLLVFRSFMDIYTLPDLPYYQLGYDQICKMDFLKVPFGSINYVKIPEVGFRLLMKFSSYISSSFTWFLLIFGSIWLILYYKILEKYSKYAIISILFIIVGTFNQSLFVLRQHMAIALVFFSYIYIIDKKIWKYLCVMALAFLMHQSALVALPLYFIYHFGTKKKTMVLLMCLVAIFSLYFSSILTGIGGSLKGYESYLDSEVQTNSKGAFIQLVILSAYIIFLKNDVLKEGINKIIFVSLFLGTTLSFVGIGFAPTSRLFMYYTSVSFMAIPKICEYINSGVIRYGFVMITLSLFYYLCFFGANMLSIINYSF